MLTTLDRAKTILQTGSDQDAVLLLLLDAASAQVESETGRTFAVTEHAETIQASGQGAIVLSQYPLITTPMVTVDGVADTDFTTHTSKGVLEKAGGWTGTVVVTCSAGYATIPADLELVVIRLAGIALNMQGSEHLTEETIGPLRSKYITDIPLYLQKIIDRYKRPIL